MSGGRAVAPRRLGAFLVALLVVCAGCASGEQEAGPDDAERAPGSSTSAPRTSSTSTSTSTTTTSTIPTTTTTTAPVPPGTPAGLTWETGDLRPGSAGVRTFVLQKRLQELKFDPGPLDGEFGSKTAMAVWAYQALNGLVADGVVTTWLEAGILTAPEQAMLRPDLGPTHTEVDLDKQVLLVFGDGRLELVTHVSTGTGRRYCDNGVCGTAVTPPGEFRYQRRIDGWRVAPLGRLYNPIYFNGGIAVHGAPSVPNQPASHGCVRIPMHIAERFPAMVANGEPISVFNGGVGAAAPRTVDPPSPDAIPPPPSDVLAGG